MTRSILLPAALLFVSACLPAGLNAADWDPMPSKAPTDKDRFTSLSEHAAKGPLMTVGVSTFFGGADHEVFRAVGELPDGRVAAFGNAWGPAFPGSPVVIGKGKHLGLNPMQPDGKKEILSDKDPDCAAFVVVYKPGLTGIDRVLRFDWGLASLSAGKVTADGKGLLLSGRCTPAFRSLKPANGAVKTTPAGSAASTYEGVPCSGDICVLRLSLDGKIEWAWVLEGAGEPPSELWEDKDGNVFFDAAGLGAIQPDGSAYRKVVARTGSGTSGWLFVDADGNSYFGGDLNTHTNREPWRQPYLYKFSPGGEKLWKLWEANPKEVGEDAGGLQSDSAVRDLAILPDGRILTAGWSDGANSVFQRLATDWKRNCPQIGFMDPWWPNGAQSFGHLNIIKPDSLETDGHLWWVSYLPADFGKKQNRTNAAEIATILPLADGSVAWPGSPATGMIQPPNSFYKYPGTGKSHGATMGVFNRDFSNLLFSSYLPGCSDLALGASQDGVLTVGGCRAGQAGEPPLAAYSVNPLQSFGGKTDGLIFSLKSP